MLNNTQIKADTGIPDIERIILIPAEHAFKITGRTSKSFDLGKACYTGLHQVAKFITRDHA